jgi:hypothetical protein
MNNFADKIAVVRQSLDIFYNKYNQWIHVGSLKGVPGVKGDKGDIGEKGDKGDKGEGLKIDHYIDKFEDIFKQSNFNKGDIIYIRETNELKYWDNRCLDLGQVSKVKVNIFDVKLSKVFESHQDMSLDRLVELKFHHSNIFMNNFYKITILFVWTVTNDEINKKFYKDGILFFSEYNGKLLENSTKFSQGFPLSNTFKHEFLVNKANLQSLRFFVKINHHDGYIRLVENSSVIQIEQL